MSNITVVPVTTKKQLRQFVDYPNQLYKDVPQFVPAFYGDDLSDWNEKQNPAFQYSEAKCWLALRDGEIVGRIGAILSHAANEKWGTQRMRFSQVDFIDNPAVSDALFATVEAWAKEKNCNQVHGPLGFSDMDREGMLVDGYDKRSMFITYYNHPYYNDHLERLGYRKDTDWIEYRIDCPAKDDPHVAKLHRIAEHVKKSRGLHIAKVKSRLGYKPYIRQVFDLANEAYSPLYGTVPLNPQQVQRYADKFIPLLDPRFTCFVLDKEEKLVAFGVSAPSMAEAMQKSRGRMFPFGWVHMLKALAKTEALDMFLIAVRPEMQGAGINAIILDHLIENGLKNGIRYAETGPQLETNSKILAQWKMFAKEEHKRRRCYIKDI